MSEAISAESAAPISSTIKMRCEIVIYSFGPDTTQNTSNL